MSDELDRALADLPGFNFPSGVKPRRTSAATKVRVEPVADDWDANPTIKKLKGVDTEFFTIGNLAAALGQQAGHRALVGAQGLAATESVPNPRPVYPPHRGEEAHG